MLATYEIPNTGHCNVDTKMRPNDAVAGNSTHNSQLCVDIVVRVEVDDGFQCKPFKKRIIDLVG